MKRDGTYWQERVLLDDIRSNFAWLQKMEERTVGEPKWFAFHAAADIMFKLQLDLEDQLAAAGRNAFYNQDKRG
jgi:hypothetical protein